MLSRSRWCHVLVLSTLLAVGAEAGPSFSAKSHSLLISHGVRKAESLSADALLRNYDRDGAGKPLVLHFHGGLVRESNALSQAKDLSSRCYTDSYPLYFVWNADLWSQMNATLESQYGPAAQSRFQGSTRMFLQNIYSRLQSGKLPLTQQSISQEYRRFMSSDGKYRKVLWERSKSFLNDQVRAGALALSSLRDPKTWLRARDRVSDGVARSVIPTIEAVQRSHDSSSVSYGGDFLEWTAANCGGQQIWKNMKGETVRSFTTVNGRKGAGLELLEALKRHGMPKKVVLVGHSTGCIYILNFLAAAHRIMPAAQFDVVFVAPANTYADTARFLNSHSETIRSFNMFGLSADSEARDHMFWELSPKIAGLYPGSLLCFVSRSVEYKKNTPILGMQRFLTPQSVEDIADNRTVRRLLLDRAQSLVWSSSTSTGPISCRCKSHGQFFDDADTLAGIRRIVALG